MNDNEKDVQKTRSKNGMIVVIASDAAIALAVIVGIIVCNACKEVLVPVLTAAFTAVGTLTTAYFGIRAASNAAQQAPAVPAGRAPAGQN